MFKFLLHLFMVVGILVLILCKIYLLNKPIKNCGYYHKDSKKTTETCISLPYLSFYFLTGRGRCQGSKGIRH